ncbi:MAG: T9SS type A sorting domain-containing protein [Draconibacterium sp.]|nr:T9SS type A sorting domain-containing protein [Draconibacterium sp.]
MKKILLFAVIGMFVTVGTMAQDNLLQNGSFEEKGEWKVTKKSGANYEFGSFENQPSKGADGCLYVYGTSGDINAEIFVYQIITLKVGETYEFSGAIKAGDGNSNGGNPNGYYYTQIVMMPVGDWDIEAEGDPDWKKWGVDNSIIFDVGNEDSDVDGLFKDYDNHYYMGSFLGEDYDMMGGESSWSTGDTVHFTVPQLYVKDPDNHTGIMHTYEDLGAAGTEVDLYFIIYCGAITGGGKYEYSVDEVSIKEYTATAVENIAVNKLSIYPNPVEGIMNVKSAKEIHSISVTNIVGQEVLKANISSNRTAVINTLDLNNGVYVVRVVDANGEILTKKIIKK